MMMECPRCGFSQPKDRYCANCGLDVEHFVAEPPPVWKRAAQNPNLHLSLIGALIIAVVGYIFYAQRELVSREVGHLFKGMPLLSRDAGAPGASDAAAKKDSSPPANVTAPSAAKKDNAPQAEVAPSESAQLTNSPAEQQGLLPVAGTATSDKADKAPDAKPVEGLKFEIGSWEMPREALATLIAGAEKISEGNGGRAYLWPSGAKAIETIHSSGRRLSLGRSIPAALNAQMALEAPMAQTDPFQFGLYISVSKAEGKEASIKWDSSLVLPVADQLSEAMVNGSASLNSNSALLLVIEPPTRTVREDLIVKAGDGPWSVLNTPEFRAGTSDWVVLIQLH